MYITKKGTKQILDMKSIIIEITLEAFKSISEQAKERINELENM